MYPSIVVKVAIARPYAEVYEFLAEPLNFVTWAANPGSDMAPLDGGDWLVELASGPATIRFAPRNTFGVLDYRVIRDDDPRGVATPVRLVPNGNGAEIMIVWLQRDGVSDERFRSDAEWLASDLQRLKALLEVG